MAATCLQMMGHSSDAIIVAHLLNSGSILETVGSLVKTKCEECTRHPVVLNFKRRTNLQKHYRQMFGILKMRLDVF